MGHNILIIIIRRKAAEAAEKRLEKDKNKNIGIEGQIRRDFHE